MCGIAGILKASTDHFPFDGSVIVNMTNSLRHRGPNDMGAVCFSGSETFHYDQNDLSFKDRKFEMLFGHRRLSILDLSSDGKQPMTDQTESVWLTFNGEIYNFIELRTELKSKGYVFKTSTDSEVIIYSYLEWGIGCFSRFNGMWALAIYDKRTGDVVLSRDRTGKKPLYYSKFKGNLIFASEVKAFKNVPEFYLKPNKRKVINYAARHYRYVDNDTESFFDGINQVPKSSYMVIKKDGSEHTEKYWELSTQITNTDISDKEAIYRFKELFIDAVRLRLRSDVPLAMNLSGGLDSTSITCTAAKELGVNVRTFSGVTGTGRFDESEYIDAVVEDVGADHTYFYPETSDLVPTISRMLAYHDEPICTVTWYSLFQISEKISKAGIPVVLTGHGGDELLGGYWDHYQQNLFDLKNYGYEDDFLNEKNAWLSNHSRDPNEINEFAELISTRYRDKKKEIAHFSKYLDVINKDSLDYICDQSPAGCYKDGVLQRRLYLELLHETVPASLRAEDRNTMAFSVESRIPFLDYRLIEFAFSLPNKFKVRNGLGKWLLRESMKGILPEKVRLRKDKAGFVAPASEWFRTKNKNDVSNLLQSDSLRRIGIFDQGKITKYFDEHITEKKDHHMILWNWINLAIWSQQIFEA
jgi:asparagine synthase (glutamine-hydrolysing)